jgi:Protein of unknown function (DUF1350)
MWKIFLDGDRVASPLFSEALVGPTLVPKQKVPSQYYDITANAIPPAVLFSRRPGGRRRGREKYYDEDDSRVNDDDDDDSYGSDMGYYEDNDDNRSTSSKQRSRRIDAKSEPYNFGPTKGERKSRTPNGLEEDGDMTMMEDEDFEEEENDDEDDYDADKGQANAPRGGYYRVYFNNDVDPSETRLDWEACSNNGQLESLVLLPPAAVERPRAVLHFVGGTFFGSAPKLWYRKFLEGIVRNTQTAMIVTPIPVTLFQSPLQHIKLSKKLQQAFEYAWYTVLEDEYGEDVLQEVPLCGIGHSLGSRLMMVLTTMNQNKGLPSKTRRKQRQRDTDDAPVRIPPYKAFILLSFTNYGASAGIPGVGTLLKQSRKQERVAKVGDERQRYQKARRARNDWWLDDDEDDGDRDELDAEWAEVVDELQSLVREQATRVKTALTPKSKDLEFFPSPDQLWKAIGEDNRYAVNETLLVQFDNDPVDQSSKLAQMLLKTNSTSIKFAHLRGTHLTPVTVIESDAPENGGSMQGLLGSSAGALWKAILGKSKTKEQEIAMQELRQSIVSYINDIVVK